MSAEAISATDLSLTLREQTPVTGFTPALRILVVEDDADIRDLNTEVLIGQGYRVDRAADGAAAWDALNSESYDLMITDNNMPKVTGVDLLKKMRAARMALPVIMATGILPAEEFRRHPWLRPAGMLTKPYTITELLCMVKDVFRATDSVREPITAPPTWQRQPWQRDLGLG